MRTALLASAAALALGAAIPAFAQAPTAAPIQAPNTPTGARPGNVIGTGSSEPTSTRSSNINRSDTRSPIAPRLPAPAIESATPAQLLTLAKGALRRNQTGAAQEALERAETRLLDRSTPQGADPLSTSPMVRQLGEARAALARGDRPGTMQIIDGVLASMGASGNSKL